MLQGLAEDPRDNDSVVALFNPAVKGQVLIGYHKEVLIVDTDLGQAVGQISFDRSNSGLVSMRPASQVNTNF